MQTMPEPARHRLVPVEAVAAAPDLIRRLREMADDVRGPQPAVAALLADAANAFAALLFLPGGTPVEPLEDDAWVELVARTIYEADCQPQDPAWERLDDSLLQQGRKVARAVLALWGGR